ncbi:MAG: hypothetical protein ABH867_04715 [Patescibacteria group bacterium]|nr:hypothetical protein [Patescibacteria group bacterium]
MKKKFLIFLALAVSAVAAVFWLFSKPLPEVEDKEDQGTEITIPVEVTIVEKRDEQIVGGDKDEHGCIGSAGYAWCQAKEKCIREWEEPCDNEEVFDLFSRMKDSLSESFSGIAKVDFNWNVEGEKEGKAVKTEILPVSGEGISATEIASGKISEIESFLKDNGFSVDVYNVSAGTIGSAAGYQKGKTVCLITEALSGFNPEESMIPTITGKSDIKVSCGRLQ